MNTTIDAEIAVTPDLHVKDGLSPRHSNPPRPRVRLFIWPLIVQFVNMANRGYANCCYANW